MNRKHFYPRSRPKLVIESGGGAMLGNCYSVSNYRITSIHQLTRDKIEALWDAGFIGMGQNMEINSKCDGTEEPAGIDVCPCVTTDDSGRPTGEDPINQYTGKPRPPIELPFYVYETSAYCDSGD